MTVHTDTRYFSKVDWCESRGYSCCNRVVVTPRSLGYRVGDTVILRSARRISVDRVQPEDWWSGTIQLQATVIAVEHYVSPSQTMLFLGSITPLDTSPLWIHTDELNYTELDYVSPCYLPYGYGKPWGLAFVGNGLDVLAILHSGATAIEFDYTITIDGAGYWGPTVYVKTLQGPGYSEAGSRHNSSQQGNVFTGRVVRTGSYVSSKAIYVGITWAEPYPSFSACRFQLSNIKFANCRGELYDAPTYFCIKSTVGYIIDITKGGS